MTATCQQRFNFQAPNRRIPCTCCARSAVCGRWLLSPAIRLFIAAWWRVHAAIYYPRPSPDAVFGTSSVSEVTQMGAQWAQLSAQLSRKSNKSWMSSELFVTCTSTCSGEGYSGAWPLLLLFGVQVVSKGNVPNGRFQRGGSKRKVPSCIVCVCSARDWLRSRFIATLLSRLAPARTQ